MILETYRTQKVIFTSKVTILHSFSKSHRVVKVEASCSNVSRCFGDTVRGPGWSNPACRHTQRTQDGGKSRNWGVWIAPTTYLSVVVPAARETMQLSGWWKGLFSPYRPHIQQLQAGRGRGGMEGGGISLRGFCLDVFISVFVFSLMGRWKFKTSHECFCICRSALSRHTFI